MLDSLICWSLDTSFSVTLEPRPTIKALTWTNVEQAIVIQHNVLKLHWKPLHIVGGPVLSRAACTHPSVSCSKTLTSCCQWAWWPYWSWNVGGRPLTRSSSGWRCPFCKTNFWFQYDHFDKTESNPDQVNVVTQSHTPMFHFTFLCTSEWSACHQHLHYWNSKKEPDFAEKKHFSWH